MPDSDSGVAGQRAQARLAWDAAAGQFPNRPDCDIFARRSVCGYIAGSPAPH